ncbi:DUF1496 domain-containing protein [Tatumella citrea]|uniref:DUF1496 domain-containing protein n=1 Tax=Tatumella citrea TaxID=53336 RepID=A0A1Y0L883_TATCI|nr:DUF1496 domain-containing protein [Tatumella citrea]ARU94147.1 hypothetical protein A7K98_10415 [Tatumella citrea]ARU98187.1 hypothetical protein A7K99_10415 [Tatumella citrea]
MRCLVLISAGFCCFSAFCSVDANSRGAVRLDIDTGQIMSVGQTGRADWQNSDRVCFYNSQRYSEGAVIKAGPVLIQCSREQNVTGTEPLIWKPLSR